MTPHLHCAASGRTPPGVRELKRIQRKAGSVGAARRTPPGVRELKHLSAGDGIVSVSVAPLPGCVN